jgi:hypothetical protein
MNFPKMVFFAVLFAFFLYPVLDSFSFSRSIFAGSFFSTTGFIAIALYALANLCFAGYSYEYAQQKKAEDKTKG